MKDLPVKKDGSWFTFSTELDGVTFGFELRWNERDEAWFVTLRDGEGNAIVSGRKVVLGALFSAFRACAAVMQAGDVYAIDLSETEAGQRDPGFDDIGTRVVLTYASDAEVGL